MAGFPLLLPWTEISVNERQGDMFLLYVYKALSLCCIWTFLLLPPAILALRLWKRNWFEGWRKWIVAVLLPPVGWALVNANLYVYSLYKWGLLAPYNDFREMPPDVLAVAQGGPGGAACIFGLFFGWLYLPIYFGLCLAPYIVLRGIWLVLQNRGKGWREMLKTNVRL
jgi:hypothetical protein